MSRKYKLILRAFAGLAVTVGLCAGQTDTFMGTVVGEDGLPIRGALIKIIREDRKGLYEVRTDKLGRYSHAGLPLGVYRLVLDIGHQEIDSVEHVRSRLGDPTVINFNLRELREKRSTGNRLMSEHLQTAQKMDSGPSPPGAAPPGRDRQLVTPWQIGADLDKWRPLADQGDAEAQFRLGFASAYGIGVKMDALPAVEWYRKSAEQNFVEASRELAALYCRGLGVTRDFTEAAKWLQKGAECGDTWSQHALGALNESGKGTPRNDVIAYMWYNVAGKMQERDILERRLSPEQIGQAQELSRNWHATCTPVLARGIYPTPHVNEIFGEARIIKADPSPTNAAELDRADQAHKIRNFQVSIPIYRRLAEGGNAAAQLRLAVVLDRGEGIRKDFAESLLWYHKAADQGDPAAEYRIGYAFLQGEGVSKDPREAATWFRRASHEFDAAQLMLGILYATGNGVPLDYAEAARWFQAAADQGFAGAQENLAKLYEGGQGVPKDFVQAYAWYSLAAAQGLSNATQARDQLGTRMTQREILQASGIARSFIPKPTYISQRGFPAPPGH